MVKKRDLIDDGYECKGKVRGLEIEIWENDEKVKLYEPKNGAIKHTEKKS